MFTLEILAQYRWQPRIGDPSVMGWLTVVAYAVAAWLALSTALQTAPTDVAHRGRRRLWLVVAGLMAFLCLNKQLDLQTLFTDIGRFVAKSQGWYEQRRGVQGLFVFTVLAFSGAIAAWVLWHYRAFCRRHKLLVIGLQLLLTFIVVRAISLHHFDAINQSRFFGFRMNSILEMGGIILVGLAAARARREKLTAPKASSGKSRASSGAAAKPRLEFVASGDVSDAQAREMASVLNAMTRKQR
jgi:hypothetical protein